MSALLAIDELERFGATREALHRVAEHVVAKARYVDDGEIRLTAFPGGFATPLLTGGRRVAVAGEDVVVHDGSSVRRQALRTIAQAAAFVGVDPGFPTQLYEPATGCDPDAPLHIDAHDAAALAAFYAFSADALQSFAAEIAAASPSELILWPEHFDQAFFTQDGDQRLRANFGASPGDDGHPQPYLYVGPWGDVADDDYWNAEHFRGAVLSLSSLIHHDRPAELALDFLRRGRRLMEQSDR